MKVVVWNCRGAADKGFAASMRNLYKDFRADLVFLLEPRVSGVKVRRIIRSLGFKHCDIIEARGFAGGIWAMWKDEDLGLRIVEKQDQFIHCCCGNGGEEDWFLIVVYACP